MKGLLPSRVRPNELRVEPARAKAFKDKLLPREEAFTAVNSEPNRAVLLTDSEPPARANAATDGLDSNVDWARTERL